jgi:ketosteroid isomerase-like protein
VARNVDLVKAAHDAFGEGDIEAVLDILDERIKWTIPASLPYGGVYNGRKEVAQFFALLPDYFEEIQLKPEVLLEGADLVMDVGDMTGRSKLGAEGDASFELRYCLVWRMRSGKAIEMEEFSDTAGLLRAIGSAVGE